MAKQKFIRLVVCVVFVFLTITYGVCAFAGSVDEIEKKQEEAREQSDELKKEQKEAEQKAAELEAAKKELKETLGDLNSDLQKLSASVSELEDEIADIEQKITQAQADLEIAQNSAAEQYESMKLRIQYMYENSNAGTIMMLFESKDFSDFLNRVEYVAQLSDYDRDKLTDYENTIEQIAADKSELESEQNLLETKQRDLSEQQEQLMASIERTQADLSTAEADSDAQQKTLKKLKDKITAMDAYEEKLEEQKAEAAAKAQAEQQKQIEEQENEIKNQESGGSKNYSASDQELLAALIYCEAGGESYQAQVAVGTVVMNRIASSYFPNTMTGVIYQSGQFTPASSGKLALVLENNLTTDSCRKAAKEVLAGKRSGSWLFFCLNNGNINGTVIGRQVFY